MNHKMADNFIDIPNSHWNSLFFNRKVVLEALLDVKDSVQGDLLDVGCGVQPYRSLFTHVKSYLGVDIPSSCHPLPPDTIVYDGESLPISSESFDWVMSTEVFEHVRYPDRLLTSVYSVLRPGGGIFLSVPFLAGVHEAPYDFRRWTNYGLINVLEQAGFERVQVKPLGNWHTAAASFLGSYFANCQKPWWTKFWLSRLVWLIKNLIASLDSVVPVSDNMCISWFVIAYKPLKNNSEH